MFACLFVCLFVFCIYQGSSLKEREDFELLTCLLKSSRFGDIWTAKHKCSGVIVRVRLCPGGKWVHVYAGPCLPSMPQERLGVGAVNPGLIAYHPVSKDTHVAKVINA